MVARNKDGRAVMVEGNPDYPVGLGLCTRGHFGLVATYSPDRLAGPMQSKKSLNWQDADAAVVEAIKGAKAAGKKVAWLGRYRTGSMDYLLSALQTGIGLSRVHWELFGVETLVAASKAVFGRAALPAYQLSGAKTILSFGMDFLSTAVGGNHMRKGWAEARDPAKGGFVTRLVCIEPRVGASSSQADLWLAPKPGTEVQVALAVAKAAAEATGYSGPATALLAGVDIAAASSASGIAEARIKEIAGWLKDGPAVALPGGPTSNGADGTALASATLLINEVIGAVGKTVTFGQEYQVGPVSSFSDVKALLDEAKEGKVGVLFIDGINPVFNLPAEAGAADALKAVDLVVQLANEVDESTNEKTLVLPTGTSLETWGDGEPVAGVHVLQQPAMVARKDSRSAGDLLLVIGKALAPAAPSVPAAIPETGAEAGSIDGEAAGAMPVQAAPVALGFAFENFRDFIKARWKAQILVAADFEARWVEALQKGGHFAPVAASGASIVLASAPASAEAAGGSGMHLVIFPSPTLLDGRHANIPWAQELPDPISTFAWTSWVEINPKKVAAMGLKETDLVEVKVGSKSVKTGFFASPGVPEETLALVLGNGRKEGRYAKGRGVDAMSLLGSTTDAASGALVLSGAKATISRMGGESDAFALCGNINQDNRPIANLVSPEDAVAAAKGEKKGPGSIVSLHHIPVDPRLIKQGIVDMFPEPQHPTYRFALVVDSNSCNGCMACVVACNLENNIPWVGPDQTRKGRGMSWIRMDRFWEGEGEKPDVRYLPVMCQQCSHAPCEGVCPVLATYHNLDGLNAMIYNRCVGTRYCANNCPYTARRFNYHTWTWPDSFKLMLNPDLLAREMGVMEKCTFCVQRIRSVKDSWRDQHDPEKPGSGTVPDAAIQHLTACASACPSGAITFGNAKETSGETYKKMQDPRTYTLLGELNTKPGVRYMARARHGYVAKAHHTGAESSEKHGKKDGNNHDGAENGDKHGEPAKAPH
jgi:molybdopterin-containing oxidoreductase family iron-sulfur binding subunit